MACRVPTQRASARVCARSACSDHVARTQTRQGPSHLAQPAPRTRTATRATAETVQAPPNVPPEPKVDVSIKTSQLDGNIKLYQCYSSDYLRFESEYGLKRGTTSNAYILVDGQQGVLLDVPRKAYLEVFCAELAKEACTISTVVLTHLNPDIVDTLACVLKTLKKPASGPLRLIMSNPSKQVLENKLGAEASSVLEGCEIEVPVSGEQLRLGRRLLQCIPTSTPRYPEMLCVYERTTRTLFSSCFFSAHVNPQRGWAGASGTDVDGWSAYATDWQYFFNCMFAPVAKQAGAALERLDVSVPMRPPLGLGRPPTAATIMDSLKTLVGLGSKPPAKKSGSRPVAAILPRHGPIIKQSVVPLITSYGNWVEEQLERLRTLRVAVLYASAYGNTASLAQTISRGITKAGVGVEMVNLEQVSLEDTQDILRGVQGFCIGSPTLGGHMPTQVSAALGNILRTPELKALPCGVYGSYGWSGEAVDLLNARLTDAGFNLAFKAIKVQFRPDAKALQLCEESGTDLAQGILKSRRKAVRQAEDRAAGVSVMATGSGAQMALGRVVGSLSVVTCKEGEAESAMLASWLSQASFDPPGITVAVKQDRAVESLMVTGNKFNVNILKQGAETGLIKALTKPFAPGQDRFEGIEHHRSEESGCVILEEAVSVLECEVLERIDAADHYIVYAEVKAGEVLDANAVSAVHHRKTGASY